MLAENKRDEAMEALENLLYLGPQNIEALSIKAKILRQQGKFEDEYNIWKKIFDIDPENEDAHFYFEKNTQKKKKDFTLQTNYPRVDIALLFTQKA